LRGLLRICHSRDDEIGLRPYDAAGNRDACCGTTKFAPTRLMTTAVKSSFCLVPLDNLRFGRGLAHPASFYPRVQGGRAEKEGFQASFASPRGEGISSRTPLRVRVLRECGLCDADGNCQKYQCFEEREKGNDVLLIKYLHGTAPGKIEEPVAIFLKNAACYFCQFAIEDRASSLSWAHDITIFICASVTLHAYHLPRTLNFTLSLCEVFYWPVWCSHRCGPDTPRVPSLSLRTSQVRATSPIRWIHWPRVPCRC
jgi:hypothetical protein